MVFDNVVQEITAFLRKGRLGNLVYTTRVVGAIKQISINKQESDELG